MNTVKADKVGVIVAGPSRSVRSSGFRRDGAVGKRVWQTRNLKHGRETQRLPGAVGGSQADPPGLIVTGRRVGVGHALADGFGIGGLPVVAGESSLIHA